jgi:hypothetical protein
LSNRVDLGVEQEIGLGACASSAAWLGAMFFRCLDVGLRRLPGTICRCHADGQSRWIWRLFLQKMELSQKLASYFKH